MLDQLRRSTMVSSIVRYPALVAFTFFVGCLTIFFVASGIHAVSGRSWVAAGGFAAALMGMQLVLWRERRGNGFWFGTAASVAYAAMIAGNVTLAAGGIVADFGADNLGATSFHREVDPAVEQIRSTALSFEGIARATRALADYSGKKKDLEIAVGGTCGGRAVPTEGEFARLRKADAARFAAIADTADGLARESATAENKVREAIAAYTVATHGETVKAIEAGLADASAVAVDPRIGQMRTELDERATQIAAGRPDDRTQRLVVCPDDTLTSTIRSVLAAKPPVQIRVGEMPSVPTTASSTRELAAALLNFATGKPYDLAPWALALIAAPIIDALLFYGLALLERKRRIDEPPLSPHTATARALGIDGGFDQVMAAAARAGSDPRFTLLRGFHAVRDTGFRRFDYMIVPTRDVAHCLWAMALTPALASDAGVRRGRETPDGIVPRPSDPEAEYLFIVLRPGVWKRIETDALRAAAVDPMPDMQAGYAFAEAAE